MLAAGLLVLYLPTFQGLANDDLVPGRTGTWSHHPGCGGVAPLQNRQGLAELPAASNPLAGWSLFVLAMLMYVVGRSQAVLFLEVGSEIPLLASMLLLFKGRRGLRMCCSVFSLFMVPLPMTLVLR